MTKLFLDYNTVRNDAIMLSAKMIKEGFIPRVIYCLLRGGAYMANVISECYKVHNKGDKVPLYAAVVAHSYTGVGKAKEVAVEGWTYPLDGLCSSDKVLIVDDIFDSGETINHLVPMVLGRGLKKENVRVCVHDYKVHKWRKEPLIIPDYYCVKHEVQSKDTDIWIHYASHELAGLNEDERVEHYYKAVPNLRDAMEYIFNERR